MTIIEALRISKDSISRGDVTSPITFARPVGSRLYTWVADWTYTLTADELLADDWEDVRTLVPRLRGQAP